MVWVRHTYSGCFFSTHGEMLVTFKTCWFFVSNTFDVQKMLVTCSKSHGPNAGNHMWLPAFGTYTWLYSPHVGVLIVL